LKKNASNSTQYKLTTKIKAHERILWSCSWTYNDQFFATCSRDKTVKIWQGKENKDSIKWEICTELPVFEEAVTAVAFLPEFHPQGYILAVGEESGQISIWESSIKESPIPQKWNLLIKFDKSISHIATVRRLAWRLPAIKSEKETKTYELASCSTDHSIRIFTVTL